MVNLCLGVVLKWALDVGNTRPALLCAERALLRTWDFMRDHDLLSNNPTMEAYRHLYLEYLGATLAYAERIRPLCLIRDGLVNLNCRAEILEYPLRTFEAIGFLSTLGINHAFCFDTTGREEHKERMLFASDTLVNLIKNNPPAITPLYDSHAIEVALGLLLLYKTNRIDEAVAWLKKLGQRIVFTYETGYHFPVASDKYEDLLDMEFDQATPKQQLMSLSTLLPTIAEWYALLGRQNEYAAFREDVNHVCEEVDLQLWYPDESTESALFQENAGYGTGVMCTSISLPENCETLRDQMLRLLNEQTAFVQLSCITHEFSVLGLIASRHFRTPVIPAYWQNLLAQSNEASDTTKPPGTDQNQQNSAGC